MLLKEPRGNIFSSGAIDVYRTADTLKVSEVFRVTWRFYSRLDGIPVFIRLIVGLLFALGIAMIVVIIIVLFWVEWCLFISTTV